MHVGRWIGLTSKLKRQTERTLLFSERSLPPITTVLLIISYFGTYYTSFGTAFPTWMGPLDMVVLFGHPFFYLSVGHVVFDTVMWLVAGTLLEKWTGFRVRNRLGIYFVCYLSSVATEYMKWKYVDPETPKFLGPSGMISAMVPFILFYYLFFHKQIVFKGPSVFAPFMIGVLFWWVVGPPFNWVGAPTRFVMPNIIMGLGGDTPVIHLLAFTFALVPASLLMLLEYRRRSRQERLPAST